MNKFLFIIISFSFVLNANCQTIDFTYQSNSGLYCTPSTIVFKQACTGNPKSYIWSFGNNHFSDKPIDSSTYLSPGIYTVKLIAVFNKTALELYKTIVINPAIKANIGFDRNYLCQPGVINFSGSGSGNVANYEWNFGDGTAIVNTSVPNISHSFANFGSKNVTLKTKSNAGCTDTSSTTITIQKFAVSGTASKTKGCIPVDVKFTSNVKLPLNSSVTNYQWNFGDGSPIYNSTIDTVNHTYLIAGEYIPSLTVTTNEGCTNTYAFPKLKFGTPPSNHIAFAQTSPVCGSDSVVFITKATNAQRYYWGFGDGTTASSTDTIIKHKYNTIGNKFAYVNAYYNECEAPYVGFFVTVKGVIAKFSMSNTCLDKNIYSFSDTSSGTPTNRLWDFGDGSQLTNTANPVHSFPTSGQFRTTLYLTDNISGCKDSISKEIYTAQPGLYSADSSLCINSPISFSIQNNYTNPAATYTWNVVGAIIGATANAGITINTDTLGNLNNFVVINYDKESCPDTVNLNRSILVRGPNLNFTSPTPICLNTSLLVTNHSTPFIASDSIKLWYWNFGNSNKNDSVYQPAPNQYNLEGSYNVQLTAIDKNGCVDTLSKIVEVNPAPYLHILPSDATVCYGKSLSLIAYHSNDILWAANNSLSCIACDTTIATPLVSGNYFATATNSFNCSVMDSAYVEVIFPFTASIEPTDVYICLNDSTTIDVNPKGKKILWTPATGISDTTAYDVFMAPLQNTTYTAILTDSAGCKNSSSATINVFVKSLPAVNAGADKFLPKGTSFSFAPGYSSNVIAFLWTPATLLNCNSCAAPNGTAAYSQKYTVKVTSDSGCVASDEILVGTECKSANIFVPKAFSPNNDNLNDLFYPNSIGVKTILKFTVYNRQGQIVFEAHNFPPNDKSFGWDGRYKGIGQAVDTYMYTMEALCEIGEKLYKRDSFILLK